jgi:hypothetical protein
VAGGRCDRAGPIEAEAYKSSDLVCLYSLFPLLGSSIIFKPQALLRWRRGIRLFWRWKCGDELAEPRFRSMFVSSSDDQSRKPALGCCVYHIRQ